MRKNIFLNLLFCLLVLAAQLSGASISEQFAWCELPELPPVSGQALQPGIASPFVGTHNEALIVAGGANFPQKMPWNGGPKVWQNDVFVLLPGAKSWQIQPAWQLPRPLAYGISVTTPDGLICIGGCDAERCYPDVFQMAWNSENQTVKTDTLPSLPFPLAFANGALIGNTIYVAGGRQQMVNAQATAVFLALDLNHMQQGWQELPSWPGDPRLLPVVAVQSNG
ncbi:sodium:solute symporter, partial [bacterium]|nr:sodium:solute symporter [bacterium]